MGLEPYVAGSNNLFENIALYIVVWQPLAICDYVDFN